MTKISNQYSLTNLLTADLTNSRLGVNNTNPSYSLDLTGDSRVGGSLIVTGNLTAQQFIVSSSVTYLTESFASGSHKFGDSSDDNHNFTGSLIVSGSANPLKVGSNLLFVSSSGFIGINNGSPTVALDVTGAGKFSTTVTAQTGFKLPANGNGTSPTLAYNNSLGFGVSGTGIFFGNLYNSDLTTAMQFRVTNAGGTDITAMTLLSSGNVGVGTTSPDSLFHIASSSTSGTKLRIAQVTNDLYDASLSLCWGPGGDGSALILKYNPNTALGYIDTTYPSDASTNWGDLIFRSNRGGTQTERMRIKAYTGNILVGTSSLSSQGTFNAYTNNANPAGRFVGGPSNPDGNIVLMVDKYSTTNTTSQWFLGFTINNQTVASGVITANGSSQAAFGSWSDRRLKENIIDLPNQLSNILALRPVEFDYIESEGGGHQTSFIAQEFEEIYPDAVGERPDGMKTLTGWGKTEAILVKAIQELSSANESLKNRIEVLENK